MKGGRLLLLLLLLGPALGPAPAPARSDPDGAAPAVSLRPRDGGAALRVAPFAGQPVTAAVRGGRLVLDFGARPLPELGDLETRLRALVAGVSADADSGRVFFLLRSGTEVTITKDDAGGLEVAFRRNDEALASIGVRIGNHPDYLRLVFEGERAAAAELERDGDRLALRFARPLGRNLIARLGRLDGLAAVEAAEGSGLRLRLADGYDARTMRLPPDRLVLDLLRKAAPQNEADTPPVSGTAAAEGGETKGEEAAGPPRTGAGRSADALPVAEAADGPGGATAGDVGTAGSEAADAVPASAAGEVPSPEIGDTEPGAVAAADAAAVPAVTESLEIRAAREGETVVLRFLWPFEVGAAAFLRAGRLWLVFDARAGSLLAEKRKIAFHAGALIRGLRQEPHQQATVLRIDLRRPVAVAMRREGTVWMLRFGERPAAEVAVRADAAAGRLLFPGARRHLRFRDSVAGEEIHVLTYDRPGTGLPAPRRLVDLSLLESAQGVAWRSPLPEVRARAVTGGIAITRPGGLRLEPGAFPPEEPAARPPAPPDAAAGAPVTETAGEGEPAAAAQTPAMVASAREGEKPPALSAAPPEHVAVPPTEPGVSSAPPAEPPRPPGEETAAQETGADAVPPETAAEGSGAVEPQQILPSWRTTLGLAELAPELLEGVGRLRRALVAELAMRKDPARQELRLQLARLYLADALGAEALAQLLATTGSPVIEEDPELSKRRAALAGASSLLLGRNAAAARHLRNPLLEDDREMALWRAVLAARENSWDLAAEELERSRGILESYPPALRFRLGLMAVMIAAQNGDAASAFTWLDRLDQLPLTAAQRDELRFIEALTLDRDGAGTEARRLLARLVEEAPWITATKAEFALVNLDRQAGRIDEAAARDAFLRQRAFWRGHPWEPTMLRELGRLERTLGRIPQALAVWRELLGRYPDAAPSVGLPAEMAVALATALDPGADPPLPLFVRLELYRRYVELLPPGEAGDRITLDLARGLLDAGLPEVAAVLLEERLPVVATGPLRRAFARLQARADLARGAFDEAGKLALQLAATGVGRDRVEGRLLAARVELARGNPWGALSALEGIEDPRAFTVRLDAAWLARDWERLAALAQPIVNQFAGRKLLSEEDALRALRVGTALWRRGSREAVARIARLVAERNPALTVETLFELMTTPLAITGDPRQVTADTSALVERLRTRLASLQAGDVADGSAAGL